MNAFSNTVWKHLDQELHSDRFPSCQARLFRYARDAIAAAASNRSRVEVAQRPSRTCSSIPRTTSSSL